MTCSVNDCIEYINEKYLVRWKIVKIREDRDIINNVYYGNNYATALSTFLNRINNFSVENLYNGTDDQYFLNKGGDNNIYTSMRSFSSYIKSQLISEYANKSHSVMDIGSGRGGDLFKYIQHNLIKNLLVTDVDKTALTELFNRWLDISRKSSTVLNTSLKGIILDINDDWKINTTKIKSIMPTSYFNVIFAHSCVHYFAESVSSIKNFVLLCKEFTYKDSHIVITCPSGEKIFDLLKDRNEWIYNENDNIKYTIKKLYKNKSLTEAGQKISVLLPFSKEKLYDEYLVNTETFKEIFEEEGFKLIQKKGFDEYLEVFKLYKEKKYENLTKGDIIWSSLFVSMIFKRL